MGTSGDLKSNAGTVRTDNFQTNRGQCSNTNVHCSIPNTSASEVDESEETVKEVINRRRTPLFLTPGKIGIIAKVSAAKTSSSKLNEPRLDNDNIAKLRAESALNRSVQSMHSLGKGKDKSFLPGDNLSNYTTAH